MTDRTPPEWALVTVMFVDIRGFTTFADRSTAREAVELLNEFFGVTIPVVTRHGGRTNQLLGDGFLAVFGAPDSLPHHADAALAASTDMLAAVDAHFGTGLRIGIGLNSGLVLVGTVGGGDLVELGVIGDPVNVASRVQDATRDLQEPLLLTEATRVLLESGGDCLVERGSLLLKGKAEPVAVHGLAVRNASWTPVA